MRASHSSRSRRLAAVGTLFLTAVVAISSTGTTGASGVPPTTWWVATSGTPNASGSSCADPHDVGTTHEAIQRVLDQAIDGDTVRLCAGTYAIGTTLTVDEDITIIGDGVAATVLDGGSATRIMSITSAVTDTTGVTIDGIQFRNGRVSGSGVSGGAILADPAAMLTIVDSLFRGNRAANEHGGAIAMNGSGADPGSLHIVGSTFYENAAGSDGGAISTVGMSSPDPTITNSTFVGNTAGREGGAVNSTFGDTRVSHSTFLDNRAADRGGAAYNTLVSSSLIASSQPSPTPLCAEQDPNELTDNVTTDASCQGTGGMVSPVADLDLTFLAPWGGDTPTVAIGANSDAIDAVSSNCPGTDQRGVSRGATCDAGAFEFVPGAATLTPHQLSLQIAQGVTIPSYTLPTATGLVSPTYRLATEVSATLPGGIAVSSSDGRLSGLPTGQPVGRYVVITASDGSGAEASLRIDTCALSRTQDGVFLIGSRGDLGTFGSAACGLDADYRMTTDIAWNSSWTGVGSRIAPFTGTFDGDGHAITGLDITGGDYSAFITWAYGASISALTFSADVEGGYGSAGLVGYSDETVVDDVHGSGTITGVSGGAGCTGGLLGEFYTDAVLTDSSFTGTVHDPDGDWVGGLIGCAGPTTGERLSFFGSVTGRVSVGGLIGWMGDTKIVDSFAVGHVTGSAQVGGLVGEQLDGGPAADPIAVDRSYVSVNLYGSNVTTGGLVGLGASTAIQASFWEAGLATAGALTAIGAATDDGSTPTGSAATDPTDLRSHAFLDAAGWAIVDGWVDPATTSDVWGVCESMGLPFHLHRHSTNPCVVTPTPSTGPSIPPLPSALVDMTGQPVQSAGPSTTVPPTTVPSTPTVPPTTDAQPQPAPGPALAAGELATFVDGRPVDATPTWGSDGSVVVRIGDTQLGMGLEPGTSINGPRGRLRLGRPVRFAVSGLLPGSSVIATLFSTPMRLGEMTAGQDGAVTGELLVPATAPIGPHRIRLDVTDSAGRPIEVWLGVDVVPADMELPATGAGAPIVPATVLLLVGAVLVVGSRRRRLVSLR